MRARGSTGPKPFFAALGVTVLGIVWFVGALTFFNYFFIYPLFLIFAGVVGMVANAGGLFQQQPQLPQFPQQPMPFAAPFQQSAYPAQQPMPQLAPPSPWCWRCGQPNAGRPVCPACGSAQLTAPSQPMAPQPMAPYGAPAYPSVPLYPPAPAPSYAPAAGYPPIPQPAPMPRGPLTQEQAMVLAEPELRRKAAERFSGYSFDPVRLHQNGDRWWTFIMPSRRLLDEGFLPNGPVVSVDKRDGHFWTNDEMRAYVQAKARQSR